jgi:pimeloyl-ACP methyl ester carboxylesterase
MLKHLSLSMLAAGFAATAEAEIRRQDFRVASDPGVELFVREVVDSQAPVGALPLILIHGARVPGLASFDLPVEDGSLAADLARAGHRVFIMDARGYGASTRPQAMAGPLSGKPLVGSHEVVRDIAATVEWAKARTGRDAVALLGWATGGHWAGMYASLRPRDVSHLVLYNTLYGAHAGHLTLGPGTSTADPKNPNRFNIQQFGAYRLNPAASLMPSWDKSIPAQNKEEWRAPEVAEAYQSAALASDPASGLHNPPAFRAPSGAMEDSFLLASGRQLWDANPISAAVLIIRCEGDFWSRPEDVTTLKEHLVNAAEIEAVTIPQATHYVHLDRPAKGRDRFLRAVNEFLAK